MFLFLSRFVTQHHALTTHQHPLMVVSQISIFAHSLEGSVLYQFFNELTVVNLMARVSCPIPCLATGCNEGQFLFLLHWLHQEKEYSPRSISSLQYRSSRRRLLNSHKDISVASLVFSVSLLKLKMMPVSAVDSNVGGFETTPENERWMIEKQNKRNRTPWEVGSQSVSSPAKTHGPENG